jgi:quinol monooxygenase YgiN
VTIIMTEFVGYKRWKLKDASQEAALVALVRDIIPHYRKLDGCVRLELQRISGTQSYLALQHWNSRTAWETTTSSDYYTSWLREYQPMLERWDRLMEFEDEWEAEVTFG